MRLMDVYKKEILVILIFSLVVLIITYAPLGGRGGGGRLLMSPVNLTLSPVAKCSCRL